MTTTEKAARKREASCCDQEQIIVLSSEKAARKRGTRCCGDGVLAALAPEEAQQISRDLDILAHPIRVQILTILARSGGQVCVCDLDAALPVKQPTVSHHLKLLRDAGLIESDRDGLWAYYSVRHDVLAALRRRVTDWLATLD